MLAGCEVRSVAPARWEPGETAVLASATVGPAGGAFDAPAAQVGLTRLSVEIEPGAVETDTVFELATDSGRVANIAGAPSGVNIVLSAGGLREFKQPVYVTVGQEGHADAKAAVGYSLETTGSLATLDLAGFDAAAGTATFATYRPATFTWVYLK